MDAINVVTIVAGLACTVVITMGVQVFCIITQKYQKNADCQTHPATPNNKFKRTMAGRFLNNVWLARQADCVTARVARHCWLTKC
jgi:hypothetical protein